MGRKARITFCNCCEPPVELKNYNAIKYHLNKMSNKKRAASSVPAAESADSDDSDSPPIVNKFLVSMSINFS
jgi:hypothetical protein